MKYNSSYIWFAVALLLALTTGGYAVWWRLSIQNAPHATSDSVPQTSDGLPLIQPDVNSLEELEQYTGGRPIPEPTGDRDFEGWDYDEHVRGDINARYSILEYTNLTNKYAALMQPALAALIEEQPDVNWAFRHFPLKMGLQFDLAMLSECVGYYVGNDSFWLLTDRIFAEKPDTLDEAMEWAVEFGGDEAQLQSCLDTNDFDFDVRQDVDRAQYNARFSSSPSFFFVDNTTGILLHMEGADGMKYVNRMLNTLKSRK